MTQDYQTGLPTEPAGSSTQTTQTAQTAQTAKDQAAGVAQSAAQSGSHLVGEAKTQAGEVGREAGRQVRGVLDESRVQLSHQAADQQRKAAGGIRSFSSELSSMAQGSSEPGIATDVVRQVATRADVIARWLDEREPGDLLEEVKTFARARPGTFLLIAAGAGLLAGRLTRGLRDASSDGASSDGAAGVAGGVHRAPDVASTTGYGFEPGGYGGSAGALTTEGSAEDTMAYATPATGAGSTGAGSTGAGYTGADDTPATGLTTPAQGTPTYGEPEPDVFGGGTAAVSEPEEETAWPPVNGAHGQDDQR